MQNTPAGQPEQLYKMLGFVHWAFIVGIALYIIVGEVITRTQADFEGFLEPGFDMEPVIRLILIGMAGFELLLAFSYFRSRGFLETTIENSRRMLNREPDASVVAGALQTTHLVRLALLESIALYGLTLYLMGGERLDLYLFSAVSALALVITRPSRSDWEDVFRSLSAKYASVPSNPWHPELSPG